MNAEGTGVVNDPEGARALARFARDRIRQELGGPTAVAPDSEWCQQPGAAFITLRRPDGKLQGCIGNLEPQGRIVDLVAGHAVAAAFRDPRARKLVLDDVDLLEVELSVLGPLEAIPVSDETSARESLRRGVDGVVLEWRAQRATFLPQMWSQLPDSGEFLDALKDKAGLPSSFWSDEMRLWRYTVERFVDPPPPRRGEEP